MAGTQVIIEGTIAKKIFENNSHVATGQATFSNPRTSSVRWPSSSNVILRIFYRTKKALCVLPDREAEEKFFSLKKLVRGLLKNTHLHLCGEGNHIVLTKVTKEYLLTYA